jgi:hypothetical protein
VLGAVEERSMSVRETEQSWMRMLGRRNDVVVGGDGKGVGLRHMMGDCRIVDIDDCVRDTDVVGV